MRAIVHLTNKKTRKKNMSVLFIFVIGKNIITQPSFGAQEASGQGQTGSRLLNHLSLKWCQNMLFRRSNFAKLRVCL